ncbi:MAG TPA: hypothetical protein VGB37_08205 [Candidatus Lokiarchaeia archaeon]
MLKKITFIGRAGVGKTSIKQVVFEGKNPKDLIIYPLEPTKGIISSIYSWMDLKVGFFDSSGQELFFLLENEDEKNKAFEKTNAIIYVFDYLLYTSRSQEIIEEIKKIYNIIKNYQENAIFNIFLHKVDLVSQKFSGNLQIIQKNLINQLDFLSDLNIYFTSLYPDLIHSTYNAIYDVLSKLSEETLYLKKKFDEILLNFPKTICFITSQNNRILIQSTIYNFDITLINELHKIITNYCQSNIDIAEIFNKIRIIDIGSKLLNILIANLNPLNPSFKYAIFVSEIHNFNKLNELKSRIYNEIDNYYKNKSIT